jgi:hypothetical protein
VLTLFTTAKAFRGQIGIAQRNALKSWKMLHSDVEVILFGDDEGAAEVCAEFGLRHEPRVERHQSGMKYLNYLFEKARAIGRYKYLCYANCDIILMDDFYRAFVKAAGWRERFLMIGQRWDADITKPVDFTDPVWGIALRLHVQQVGFRQAMHYIDYFAFSKGVYDEIPRFLLGRSWWDHWLVWRALSSDVPVIDCSSVVTAVHQNHAHTYHPQGKQGTHEDVLAEQNKRLAGDGRHLRIIADSTHILVGRGVIRRAMPFRRFLVWTLPKLWKFLIFRTFRLRKALGLRRENLSKLARKLRYRL